MTSEKNPVRRHIRRGQGWLDEARARLSTLPLPQIRSPWARWGLRLGGALLLLYAVVWVLFLRGLPDEHQLLAYQPPLPTHIRGIDGTPVREFARERRVYLIYGEIPQQLVHAFISAEDKTFFEHSGLDYAGIAQAVVTNVKSMGSDKRPIGASTITQQVAKNLLLNNEVSLGRKAREAFLARRIEHTFNKQQILELYLNQIFLGRNAYGIQAASRAYFGTDVGKLSLAQVAYLAVLPKGPNNYNPVTKTQRALDRRNWVLGRMEINGYITAAQRAEASAEPLGTVRQAQIVVDHLGDYFLEDVRRTLIDKYGEDAGTSPNSVYAGGLWVRTSIDPTIQRAAEAALRDALAGYDRQRGWRGPADHIDTSEGWPLRLAQLNLPVGYSDWRAGVVLGKGGGEAELGFADGSTGVLPASNATWPKRGVGGTAFGFLKVGDVIPVKRDGSYYALRQIPEISGGMVVEDPHTGRVLAMVGGFDARRSQFNRASQALRQPGSSFKPFVYATALDNGMTPASIVVDAPFCVYQSARLGQKCFRNFTGGYAGPQTMRWGVEQSRNLMTVRTAAQVGMDKVVATAKTMGIGSYPPVLAVALGAGETTVLKLTNAYSMLANGGKALEPTLIDMVQDRNGKTIFRADTRPCEGCNAKDWNGQAMPRPPLRTRQLMDPLTAYQTVHILEGVVQRGTAVVLRSLDRPLMGKTGTTTGPTNVWFVGGSPDLIAGVYMGYDQPRSLGGGAQGGTIAAPIFRAFAERVMKDMPKTPFVAPPGIRMVRIDRRSGRKVFGAWPTDEPKAAVIWEAFKPESEPRRTSRRGADLLAAPTPSRAARSDSDFLQSRGGIY